MDQSNLETTFAAAFVKKPEGKVRSPGRVNLIGEHTDYNGGFVLPCALDLYTTTVFRVRQDKRVRIKSLAYPDYIDIFDLTNEISLCDEPWANYVRGVFYAAQNYGFQINQGLDLLISSNIPHEGGLASSAALSTSVAGAIAKGLNLPIDKRMLALIAQRAENDFLGKKCGVMDQLTATMCKKDNLLLIDCEDFGIDHIPLPPQLAIVIIDSCTIRQLRGNEYNDRRHECERAAHAMQVKSLRHASIELLSENKSSIDETAFRRARHVITENDRTVRVANALKNSNTRQVYKLMYESHESMKNDFEITTPQLDALVAYCQETLGQNGGARMTGGGFGGSIIALCDQGFAETLAKTVTQKYFDEFKIRARAHICRPSDSIRVARLSRRQADIQ